MSRLPTLLEIIREENGLEPKAPRFERSERLPVLLAVLAFTILLAVTI